MTPEQIISLAYDCDAMPECRTDKTLIEFAKAIQSITREECAKVCDASSHRDDDMGAILAEKIRSGT